MIRLSLAAFILVAAPVAASAETVTLGYRPGGFTHQHILQANRWLAAGMKVVIRGDQVSAAAIQVVYFKRRGGRTCFAPRSDASLHFHLSESRGKFYNPLAQYLGRASAAKIGRLSAARFKRFHPSAFGIKACAKGRGQ